MNQSHKKAIHSKKINTTHDHLLLDLVNKYKRTRERTISIGTHNVRGINNGFDQDNIIVEWNLEI